MSQNALLRGFFKRQEGKGSEGLKKRWCVLKPLEIEFHDDQKEIQSQDIMPLLEISKVRSEKSNLVFMTNNGKVIIIFQVN